MLNDERDLFHSTATHHTHPHFLISLNGLGLALVLLASACATEQSRSEKSSNHLNFTWFDQPLLHLTACQPLVSHQRHGDLPRLELFQVSLRMELRDETLPSSFAFDLGEGAGATAKSRKNSGEGRWKGWLVDVRLKFHNSLWRNNDRGQQL